MQNPTIGARVRVSIQAPAKYTEPAVAGLDGRAGAITERTTTGTTRQGVALGYEWLVTFDEPAPPFYTHGTPHAAFWFPASDLVAA